MPRLIAAVVRNLPGADLLARGFDFIVADPLHHYMDTGLLKGVKKRADGAFDRAEGVRRVSAGDGRPALAGGHHRRP